MASSAVHISIVIPVFNEEGSLALLHGEIAQHVGGMGRPWEVLYIDDHSTDSTPQVLRELGANDPHIRTLRFSRNFGQTAAMAAGFEHALGEVVVTLDADLQNDPADIRGSSQSSRAVSTSWPAGARIARTASCCGACLRSWRTG